MVTALVRCIILFLLVFSTSVYAKTFGSALCKTEGYTCYTVKKGDNWKKLYPDEKQRDLVMRINRMNTKLHPGAKIAIPTSQSIDLLAHAPFPATIEAPGKKTLMVSIKNHAFGAYNADGTLVHWGPISGGKSFCPDVGRKCTTVKGKFTVYTKKGAGCVSSKYPVGKGGAPMPYCMFFHKGYALHGSPTVPGYHDSHGCVRLFVDDAKWLNQEFTHGERTAVVVNP